MVALLILDGHAPASTHYEQISPRSTHPAKKLLSGAIAASSRRISPLKLTALQGEALDLPRNPAARLREAHRAGGWIVDDILAHCPPQPRYDEVAQVELTSWNRGRITLVGDAGLAVSLLAGQGASLALRSAFALTAALYEERDVHTALHRYESSLKPEVERRQAAGRRSVKWVVPSSRWHVTARNATLVASQLPV